jgi:octanoyl-[GcvH]:protein N-octanoyltransferase
VRLTTVSHPHEPVLDMALSHALLRGVAAGDLPEISRVFRPGPTMAFGRLDALRPGYERARAAAGAQGWTPVLRLGGGHAAAYDENAVVVELITRTASISDGTQERFASGSKIVTEALAGLGVETVNAQLAGEYCPGRWSLHLRDGPKVAGAAQRSIRGASLFTAVVVVSGGDRLREVLVAVYDALGLPWTPSTAGAIGDDRPDVRPGDVVDAVVGELRRTRGAAGTTIAAATIAEARKLVTLHG